MHTGSLLIKGIKEIKWLSTIIIISLSFLLLSCARESSYVEVIKPPKTTSVEKGYKTDSYVVNGERYYPLPDSHGFVQYGKASWYGEKFHGRTTSSGETFDMNKISAAHKTLPLGTYVKVVNLSNNKDIAIRINDRGPFVKGRIIDLSYAAAKEIELIGPGTADVKVIALAKEIGKSSDESGATPLLEIKDLETGEFTIQVGAFIEKNNALKLVERLKVIYEYVEMIEYNDTANRTLYRVYVSKSKSLSQASEKEKILEDMGFNEAFIVRL